MTHIAFPLRIDGRGRVANVDEETHIRQLIEQLLFTAPGERVNRPEFGTGVRRLVFAPNSEELATATEYMIQSALQQWLAERIQVEQVTVASDEARLRITILYRVRRDQQRRQVRFEQEV